MLFPHVGSLEQNPPNCPPKPRTQATALRKSLLSPPVITGLLLRNYFPTVKFALPVVIIPLLPGALGTGVGGRDSELPAFRGVPGMTPYRSYRPIYVYHGKYIPRIGLIYLNVRVILSNSWKNTIVSSTSTSFVAPAFVCTQ